MNANTANHTKLQITNGLTVACTSYAFNRGPQASWRKSGQQFLSACVVGADAFCVSVNMSHETATENPLLSIKPSDSNLSISLHPLVLLTVSDHITRHRVRGEAGPVVGALLGQQKGRETTIEHAFQCKVITSQDGEIILDQSWFEDRLQQCK
jgi:hypothetical protein